MPTILVIDDSLLMRKICRDSLEEVGLTVTELLPGSVAELVEWLQKSPPQLVLSDFNMPGIDGRTVACTVRQINPRIPVIILTANRDEARDAKLKALGVRKILHKPIGGTELATVVGEVLAVARS